MLFNQFINRRHELEELASFFAEPSNTSKVILVSGKSGVGKSQLTDEFVKRSNIRRAIRVACPVPTFDKTVKDGIFIRNLSQKVNEIAEAQHLETITTFANRLGNHLLIEDYERRLLDDGRKFGLVSSFTALRTIVRRKRKELYTTKDLFRVSSTWQPIVHRDYVLTALRNIKSIIVMENFQLVDYESLILIQDLVQKLLDTTWILEYTESDNSNAKLRTFDEFDRLCGHRAKALPIAPIPLEEIVLESKRKIAFDATPVIEQQYRSHGGNLRILLDASLIVADSSETSAFRDRLKQQPSSDATAYRMELLSQSGIFLVALILANDARVEKEILELIYDQHSQSLQLQPYADTCKLLLDYELTTISEKEVVLAHDNISTAFHTAPARSIVFKIALNASAQFYDNCLELGIYSLIPIREANLRLLKIRLQTSPLMVFAQFSLLRNAVLSSASRGDAERFLRAVKDSLQKESGVAEATWWDLAHLCYEASLFTLGAEIAHNRSGSKDWQLLRGFVLHNLDNNEEAIAEIEPLLHIKCPPGAMLTALILKMICLRALGRFEDAKDLADLIGRGKEYQDEPEFGHFLRNVEFLIGPEAGLVSVERSIAFFAKRRESGFERQARVTRGMQLARLGRIREALSEFGELLKTQPVQISDSHLLWNDLAAAEMMDGRFTQKQCGLLERARLTGAIPFDQIITSNNLALWHANNGHIAEALRLFSSIEQLVDDETDKHIRCAIFFNRSLTLLRSGRVAESAQWKQRLRSELLQHDVGYRSYWEARAGLRECNEAQFQFLLTVPYHYLFLVHWSFPLRIHFDWS